MEGKMNLNNYSYNNNSTENKSLNLKELHDYLNLDINQIGLPLGKANQLLEKEKFNYEDCINLVVLEYLSSFKDSTHNLFTEGEA